MCGISSRTPCPLTATKGVVSVRVQLYTLIATVVPDGQADCSVKHTKSVTQ